MKTKMYTVKCDGKFCGDSVNGLVLSESRPFRNVTSSTEDVARLRKRSFELQYKGRKFEVVEV